MLQGELYLYFLGVKHAESQAGFSKLQAYKLRRVNCQHVGEG